MEEKLTSGLFSTTDPGFTSGNLLREMRTGCASRNPGEQVQGWSQTSKTTLFVFVFLECHLNKDMRNEFETSYLTEGGIIIPVGRAAAFFVGPFRALHVGVVAVVGAVIAGRGVMLENRIKKLGILRKSSSFHKYNEHKRDKFTLCILS